MKMEEIRSKKEIITKIFEFEKELGYRYTESTKELIRTKIDILNWVLKRT